MRAVPCPTLIVLQLQALNAAITCTILGAAGPQRSRMLATLYKASKHAHTRPRGSVQLCHCHVSAVQDERAEQLPLYPFVERVYLERILRP
jgi:COP9 signalosome complex subunit 4